MTGAECRLGWEAGSRSTLSITRKLSQFGVEQHDVAGEEEGDAVVWGAADHAGPVVLSALWHMMRRVVRNGLAVALSA